MASVLTPYKSSDGNNPYTEAQLKVLWKDLEPTAREPGKYTVEERLLLQREFLRYIQLGYTPTRAVTRMQDFARGFPDKLPFVEYATFMAWKAYDKEFAEAYEVAYAMGTDTLEDKGVDMATSGNAAMLQFLLRVRNPGRYSTKAELQGTPGHPIEHVHRIELIAASAKVLEVEEHGPEGQVPMIIDAEVVRNDE